MKILHCIATLTGGGAERQLCYLAKGLVDAGHEVRVACMRLGANATRLRMSGATVEVSGLPLSSPRNIWHVTRIIRQFRPDIVQTWLLQMDIWGGMATIWTGTPWILNERSSRQAYPATWGNRLRLLVARHAAVVVANSGAGEEYWRQELGQRLARSMVIYNSLPLEELDAVRPYRPLSIASSDKIIVLASRLDPSKNLRMLLRSLSIVLNNAEAQVLVCGEGPEEKHLRLLVSALGISTRVHFLGYVSDLPALLKAADVFVSVSRFEGQPNAVMEAMACGCPTVASDIPEHREFLNEKATFFAHPDSIANIAEQILLALRVPSLAIGKARQARSIAQSWHIRGATQQYSAVYRSLMPDSAQCTETPSI